MEPSLRGRSAPRLVGLVLLCAGVAACGYPRPEPVGTQGDAGGAIDGPGADAAPAADGPIADAPPPVDAPPDGPGADAVRPPDAAPPDAAPPDAPPPDAAPPDAAPPDAPPCGARGQACCGVTCNARAVCDGTTCMAADVWASGPNGTYRFDGSWHPAFLGSNNVGYNALWGTSSTNVVGVGTNGLVARYDGATWTREVQASDSTATLYALGGSGPNDIWAGGLDGFAHYSGGAWTRVPFLRANPLTGIDYSGIWLYGPGNGFACSHAYSTTVQLADGVWQKSFDGPSNHDLGGLWGASASRAWAVGHGHNLTTGDPGKILQWDGGAWSTATLPAGTPALTAIWGTDATHVWAVGRGGAVLFHDGATWASRFSSTADDLSAIWGSGPRDVWVVGAGGAIHYNGQAWTAIPGLPASTTVWLSAD